VPSQRLDIMKAAAIAADVPGRVGDEGPRPEWLEQPSKPNVRYQCQNAFTITVAGYI
jgi:hypothetical protein